MLMFILIQKKRREMYTNYIMAIKLVINFENYQINVNLIFQWQPCTGVFFYLV